MPYTIKFATNSLDLGSESDSVTAIPSLNALNLVVNNKLTLSYLTSGFLSVNARGQVTSQSLDGITISDLHLTGVSDAPTASLGTATNQIATTLFVKNACDAIIDGAIPQLNTLKELSNALNDDAQFFKTISDTANSKVSLTGAESISGTKTFVSVPVFSSLIVNGIVHNDESGKLSTSLIQTVDIADGVITGTKMASDLVLPSNTQLDTTTTNENAAGLVVKQFLSDRIKPFTDTLSNTQPTSTSNNIFFHVTSANVTHDTVLNKNVFILGNNIRHIIEVKSQIILPAITPEMEGTTYHLINKSDTDIQISTSSITDLIFNSFVAPDGDNDFNLGTHQCLEFVCISANSKACWQASFY